MESIVISSQSYPYLNETLAQDLSHKNTMAELPTCPVCLERMDESVTGLLGIQCHHTSQCYCLNKWGENRCPVCQYSHKPVLSSLKKMILPPEEVVYECCECISTDSLWICMICGHIGCGRYQEAHAYDHYMDTNHLYALEIETQRVWDYLGDGYVHKLIQNTIDGAIVELPPSSTSSSSHLNLNDGDLVSKRNSDNGINYDHSASGGSSTRNDHTNNNNSNQQGKLDTISVDYSYMLASQLDSQRMYYEDQLDGLATQLSDLTNKVKIVSNEMIEANMEQSLLLEKGKSLDLSIIDIKKEKEKSDKRATSYKDKFEAMQNNLNEEKVVSKSVHLKFMLLNFIFLVDQIINKK